MKIENKANLKKLDYKAIQKLSHRIDCTITEADFDTSRPNLHRVDYMASDIYRYTKRGGVLI